LLFGEEPEGQNGGPGQVDPVGLDLQDDAAGFQDAAEELPGAQRVLGERGVQVVDNGS
jgi:hypothetical protein